MLITCQDPSVDDRRIQGEYRDRGQRNLVGMRDGESLKLVSSQRNRSGDD
mgnify:CR=1 FL=1